MAKPLVDDELWAAVRPLLPKHGPRSLHLSSLLLEHGWTLELHPWYTARPEGSRASI